MKMLFRSLLIAAGFVFPVRATAEEAKTYTLKLHRPPSAGDKSHEHFKISSEQSRKVSLGKQKLDENAEDFRGDFSGILEVLEVSPHGKPLKLQFTVETFKCQNGVDAETEPFKAGTVITAKVGKDDKAEFSIPNGKIEETAEKVLKGVMEMSKDRENDTTDDIVFGTDKPRAAGSEWPLDNKAMAKSIPPDFPFKVTESELSGTVKLAGMKSVDGVEHGILQSKIDMKPSSLNGLPPAFKISSVSVKVTTEKLVPLDEKRISPSDNMKMEMQLTGTVDSPNGKATIEVFSRVEKQSESKPVK
ncbi:MAG TPA: hypothetical protein VG796_27315 [Verrucomicrobiales bacterium]|jgi:hypothetical protein|nr:hypothetical protein [Verrucomicrobiales bacterium]